MQNDPKDWRLKSVHNASNELFTDTVKTSLLENFGDNPPDPHGLVRIGNAPICTSDSNGTFMIDSRDSNGEKTAIGGISRTVISD